VIHKEFVGGLLYDIKGIFEGEVLFGFGNHIRVAFVIKIRFPDALLLVHYTMGGCCPDKSGYQQADECEQHHLFMSMYFHEQIPFQIGFFASH
jgi:hypothetical protein